MMLTCICTVLKAQDSQLELRINNIKPGPGIVRIAVCESPDQFPDNPGKHYSLPKEEINNNSISLVIQGLRPGAYAITLLDDKNGNGEMDTGILGIPKEGFGFSNDVKPTRKPPSFEKCTFQVREGFNYLAINMQYFTKGK